jgi:major type 1 subunit fimbrin (pilin)
MKHKILSVAVLAAATLGAQVASASDGTITFTGAITSATCTINGGGANSSFTVALPRVSATSFAGEGAASGRTAFALNLTDCAPATGNVHAYFNPGVLVNVASGNLLNDTGVGLATGIELTLRNPDASKIQLGAADVGQNSKAVALDAGAGTLNYWVEYTRTAAIVAGGVSSSVVYDIVYQ